MAKNQTVVTDVKIADLHLASFNPTKRTQDNAIRSLINSMREFGQLAPITITSKNEVADGHRRIAAALQLGWDSVHATIAPAHLTLSALWVAINADTKPINGAAYIEATHRGLSVEQVRGRHRVLIETAMEWMGEGAIALLAEYGKSTDVIGISRKIGNFIGAEQPAEYAKVLSWIVRHNMALVANQQAKYQIPAEMFVRAIDEDRPITIGAFVA